MIGNKQNCIDLASCLVDSQISLGSIGLRQFNGNLGNKNLECQATKKIKLLSTCYGNHAGKFDMQSVVTFKKSCS